MKVGDVVYRETHCGGPALEELKITGVGRKWIKTDRDGVRIDKATMAFDTGGYGHGRKAWLSRDDYMRELVLNATWARFRSAISATNHAPDGMTLERIAEARRVLGMGDADGSV